jgi:uncharacterized membrane protein
MDAIAITIGISWTVVGLLCIGLAVPLVRGQVGRNAFYGVRFPESFQSDEAWFAINRFGGRRFIVWSVPLVVIGIASFFLRLQSHTGVTLAIGFAPLVFIFIPVLETWRFARRYWPRV